MLYHVSSVSGIAVFKPRISSHGKAYVYAVNDLVLGLLFGAKHDDFDFLLDTNEAGLPEVFECYPGAFRSVYQGRGCSVYEVQDQGFLQGMTSWSPELVCESEVPVETETFVPDLYSRLLEEAAKGTLILHSYQNIPEYKGMISRHIVDRLIRFDAMDRIETDSRFQKYYKGIVEALNSVMDGHLLGGEI